MSEKKIVVPEGMIRAVEDRCGDLCKYGGKSQSVRFVSQTAVEAALRWLSENPILPTAEQLYSTIGKLPVAMCDIVWTERDRALIAEWQRRMFLAPEPEVPEEIKDLWQAQPTPDAKRRTVEAFQRGQQVSR